MQAKVSCTNLAHSTWLQHFIKQLPCAWQYHSKSCISLQKVRNARCIERSLGWLIRSSRWCARGGVDTSNSISQRLYPSPENIENQCPLKLDFAVFLRQMDQEVRGVTKRVPGFGTSAKGGGGGSGVGRGFALLRHHVVGGRRLERRNRSGGKGLGRLGVTCDILLTGLRTLSILAVHSKLEQSRLVENTKNKMLDTHQSFF